MSLNKCNKKLLILSLQRYLNIMSNKNNSEWEDAKITVEGEELTSFTKRLLDHKVDRKEIMMWNVALIGINVSILAFFLNSFSSLKIEVMNEKINEQRNEYTIKLKEQDSKLKEQDSKLKEQDSKLREQDEHILQILLELERFKK